MEIFGQINLSNLLMQSIRRGEIIGNKTISLSEIESNDFKDYTLFDVVDAPQNRTEQFLVDNLLEVANKFLSWENKIGLWLTVNFTNSKFVVGRQPWSDYGINYQKNGLYVDTTKLERVKALNINNRMLPTKLSNFPMRLKNLIKPELGIQKIEHRTCETHDKSSMFHAINVWITACGKRRPAILFVDGA